MNILLITHLGDIAGSTNSISYLAMGLAEKGHNVYVGCRKESLLFQLLSGSKAHLLPMTFSGRFDLKNIKQVRDAVRKYDIQLINAQSGYDRYSTVFAKWLYKLNVKIVHTRRQAPRSIGGFFQNLVYIKGTDKVVVISDELKRTFEAKGTPGSHIQVIYNGIPASKFREVDPDKVKALHEKFNLSEGDRVIGSISRLKNQYQIIEALQYVPQDVKVLFAGIEKGSLDRYVRQFGIKNEIIYAGLVDPKEIMNYYPLLNLNILASTMDGFGLVLVEAMGLGIPVVATAAYGIKDVVKHGVNGLLFEDGDIRQLADHINLLLNDEATRTKLIQNGLKSAMEDFSIEKTITNYELFFQNLINS